MLHALPSQWMVKVSVECWSGYELPTAHTSSGATADMPCNRPLTRGVGTMLHLSPFQCRVSGLKPFGPLPAAQASLGEITVTPYRRLGLDPKSGSAESDHLLSSQCIASALTSSPLLWMPTAQTSAGELPATDLNISNVCPVAGAAKTVQQSGD